MLKVPYFVVELLCSLPAVKLWYEPSPQKVPEAQHWAKRKAVVQRATTIYAALPLSTPLGGGDGGRSRREGSKAKTQGTWIHSFHWLCFSTEALSENIHWVFQPPGKELLDAAREKSVWMVRRPQ